MSKHKELLEAIERSRGCRIFEYVENLITAFYIVEQNHKQLWEFLSLCDKKDFVDQLNPMHSPQKLSAYVNELSRLLHNFAAATKTLIDHTRNHVNDLYGNLPFYEEYQAKLKAEISDKPLLKRSGIRPRNRGHSPIKRA